MFETQKWIFQSYSETYSGVNTFIYICYERIDKFINHVSFGTF